MSEPKKWVICELSDYEWAEAWPAGTKIAAHRRPVQAVEYFAYESAIRELKIQDEANEILTKQLDGARDELKKFVKFDAFLKDDGTAEELAAEKARSAKLVEALHRAKDVIDFCYMGQPKNKHQEEIEQALKEFKS